MKKGILTIAGLLVLLLTFAVWLFHHDPEPAKFTITVITAIGVISAVMFAAYGDELKTLVSPVRVRIEAVSRCDNFPNKNADRTGQVEQVITYHLLVRNGNPARPAMHCGVKLVEVWEEDAQGHFVQPMRFAVPRLMVWAPGEENPTERTVRDEEIFDFGNLFLSDGEFRLKYLPSQGGVFDGNCVLGKRRRYVFRVAADGMVTGQEFSVDVRPKRVTASSEWPYSFSLDIEVATS